HKQPPYGRLLLGGLDVLPGMIIGPAWAVPMDIGGEYSGIVSGIMNMAGDIGGGLSPHLFGYLVAGGARGAAFRWARAWYSSVQASGRSGSIRKCPWLTRER